MSRYELNNLQNVLMKAAKAVFDHEKFPVGVLAVRAKKLAELYPQDNTVVGMYSFLTKRATNSKDVFIARCELRDVYNKLYSSNNKFASEFKDELGLVNDNNVTLMKRDPNEGHNLIDESYAKLANPLLSEQLSAAMDNKPHALYSAATAKLAQKSCAYELNSHGALPKRLDVVAGQEDVLICRATYDTPMGVASMLIPVEIKEGKALLPSMFLSTAGFVALNADSIKDHLKLTAGKKFTVDSQKLLKAIATVKNGTAKPISDVEQMVIKVTASKETPATYDANAILNQEIDPENVALEMPKLAEPDGFEGIGDYLSSSAGNAEFLFGKDTVERGRKLVISELAKAGIKRVQAVVATNTEDSIRYAVSIGGTFGFNINTKVKNNQVSLPKLLVVNGSVYEFNREGLNKLVTNSDTDPVALAKTSPLYNEKPGALVERIRFAMANDNYAAAEDALHVLKQSGDDYAFKVGYDLYVKGLGGQVKADNSVCSAPIESSASKYMLCSHTGLPVHKVYQDKYGNCRPLYRKGMEDSSDGGASFTTSKVLFE